MRILVTGASGFVGRVLCPVLAARGHEVYPCTRSMTGDLAAFDGWPHLLEGVQAVVHLAALAHGRGVDGARLQAVNVGLPVTLGRAAAQAGARMLFLSSVYVHGESTAGRPFVASSPIAPVSAYGRAKAAAERALHSVEGLALTVIRPPLVYGPGVKANFFSLMHAVARGWPLPFAGIVNRLSLVFSGNLASAIADCLDRPDAAGRSFLVSDDETFSTPELCSALGDALGRPARLFVVPPWILERASRLRKLTRSLEVDDSDLRRDLQWAPPHTREQGIRAAVEWYRSLG